MIEKINKFRQQFPHLNELLYLNHGVISVMPENVVQAALEGSRQEARYSSDREAKGKSMDLKQITREMAAKLIGASAENIAFVANTSSALSLISLAIRMDKGCNVIASGVENPATVVPWQNLNHLAIEVRYLPANKDDIIDISKLAELVDDKTRVVCLSLVQYSTGQRLDIKKIVDFCEPRDILVVVDAVQAVGAIPVNVEDLGVSFLCSGIQKWMMGPQNLAILYADDKACDLIRSPIVTESNVADIAAVEEKSTIGLPQLELNSKALKLEAIPYQNFPGLYALNQILKNIESIGQENIHQRIYEITSELIEGLTALDGRVVSPRGQDEWSGIVSFSPNHSPAEIVENLYREKIIVAVRKGRIRICPHFYTTSGEIQLFLRKLEGIMNNLK